jgi:hypothetical protein
VHCVEARREVVRDLMRYTSRIVGDDVVIRQCACGVV